MHALATENDSALESCWWVCHHSLDPKRRLCVLTCYLDESGTDNGLPVAVVGGVVVKMEQYYWLNKEWKRCLDKHQVPGPLHMMEFGAHGSLKDWDSERRRALFSDVADIINGHTAYKVAGTLERAAYKRIFSDVTKFSMYGAAFLMVAMANGIMADRVEAGLIGYLLDEGNPHAKDILAAYQFIRSRTGKDNLHMGSLGFDKDSVHAELQIADVVAWTVRRKMSSRLASGFEPLERLLEVDFLEAPYKEEWMADVASDPRVKINS